MPKEDQYSPMNVLRAARQRLESLQSAGVSHLPKAGSRPAAQVPRRGAGSQKSEVRSQKSEVRSQKSEVRSSAEQVGADILHPRPPRSLLAALPRRPWRRWPSAWPRVRAARCW